MKPIFCFIDDSHFELNLFGDCLAPAGEGLEFITGTSYEDVRTRLGERYPCAFLLDLYGRDPEITRPSIIGREELESAAAQIGDIDGVYHGLDQLDEERVNEFLKRLFQVADGWRRLFYDASRRAGQSIRYGLDNLAAARRDYPAAVMVGYTRKSLIMDAVEVLNAGIDRLDLKPNGPDDEAIREATRRQGPALLEEWSELVTRNYGAYMQNLVILLRQTGLADQVSNLTRPERLSEEARALFGPGDVSFISSAAAWWEYAGLPDPD